MSRKQKTLFWHLYPTYLLVSLIAVIGISWYASGALRDFYLEQTRRDLDAKAYLFERQLVQHMSPLDIEAIDLTCKTSGRRIATRLTVIMPTGIVIGDTDENPARMDNHRSRPEIAEAIAGKASSAVRYSRTLQQRMMYVAVPLRQGDKIAAVIRVSLSISDIDDALNGIQVRIAWGGLLIALIAALLSYVASRYISRPIEAIKKGAQEFATGKLSHPLPFAPTLELNSLSASLTEMAGQLRDQIHTVTHQRNELEAVLSGMVEGVMAIDRDERILNANRAAARIFDSEPDKIKGRLIQEIIRNPDLQQFVNNALSGEARTSDDIVLFKDRQRIINAYCTPLRDPDGNPIGSLLVLHDVTQLRRLENIRRDFVANVSHEIKTPLTAIKGFVETLLNGDIDHPEESRRFLAIIAKHVDRLNAIVEDLLSLSRMEQDEDKKELSLSPVRLCPVIKTALGLCQAKSREKNIFIALSCDDELNLRIDATLIEQALVNLIDNAIKYSPRDSRIDILTEDLKDEIVIRVKDQGLGISRQHLPRLFERFYRVDKARSRDLGGTGLGLAIVKHIVQAHGGRIEVESVPGKGSTFKVYLKKILI